MEKYTKAVDDIKTKNIETFREIQHTLHPPTSFREPTRQVQPQVPMPMSFKPCPDLRPSILMRDCTLRVVEHFNEKFANYMRSGPNQIILPRALYSQVCVNIDPYWLTEIRERGFTKDTNLEEFIKLIDLVLMFKFPLHMK